MTRALSVLAALTLVSSAAFADDAPVTTTTTTTTTTAPANPMPEAGKPAPDFTLPSQDGTPVKLSDFKGKWVVLYFYPKDFTGGCTLEAQNFQKDLAKYKAEKAVILGVSVDSVSSHKDFCAKESLEFKLLADPSHDVVAQYGSTMDYKGATYAARTTFLIDPKGVIRKVYPKVDPAKHSAEVLADLDGLKKAKKS
jgi:thioredoxin-dependent peroxiredoxin